MGLWDGARCCAMGALVTLVVDPWHWLEKDGSLPTGNLRLRRQVLRVVRLIEYGGPLEADESRETLVECKKRPGRVQCLGLLWVTKTADGRIVAYCPGCGAEDTVISNWEDTLWAGGMMEPVPRPDPGLH